MDHPTLSLRIDLPGGGRFGPGKAALLRAIETSGSIRAAANGLNMSYPRALKLIDQMNSSFTSPLLVTQHGGADGGGAEITALGRQILQIYEEICAKAADANDVQIRAIMDFLAD